MDETSKIIVNQSNQMDIMKRQIDELQAENERQAKRIAQLVEALRMYVRVYPYNDKDCNCPECKAIRNAKAALEAAKG